MTLKSSNSAQKALHMNRIISEKKIFSGTMAMVQSHSAFRKRVDIATIQSANIPFPKTAIQVSIDEKRA